MTGFQHSRNIQGLRGFAALAVLIGHADGFGLIQVPPWLAACGIGAADVFFVISGFIICQIVSPDHPEGGGGRAALFFLVKRCLRIYPLYWTVFAAATIGSLWLPLQYEPIACNRETHGYILLIGGNCLIPPVWTLQYELYFYTVIAALLLLVPRTFYATLMLLMLAQASYVVLSGYLDLPQGFLSSPLLLEFGAGCAISWLHRRGFQKWAMGSLLLGVVAFSFGAAQAIDDVFYVLPRILTFGLGGALVLHAVIMLEAKGVFAPRPIEALGDASYSLYLCHWPLLTISAELELGWYGVAAAIALSFACHRWIENPLGSLALRFRELKLAHLS